MSVRVGFGRFLNILHALSCMFLLTTVAEKEHWSTKQAAFSIAQADDATTSRDLIESFNSPSDLACSQKCLQNDKCRFKIYHVETKKCELLASIYEEDFMDEKAIPFKKEKILTKKDGFCNSASSSGCRESCECVKLWQFGKNGYICDCTKQEKEHWSTKQAAFSIAQTDDATKSRDLIESFNSPSDLACSQKCLRNDKCRFKIYHIETKKCELLASIYEEDFMDEKAIPFKKEKILTKDDWVCESALGMQNSKENCECANVSHSGEWKNICNCTKQEKEHWSTKQAAFSIAQTDDATKSRDLIESFNSPSDLACSQKCLRNDKCRFKIYHVETKKCKLLASIYEEDFMDEKAIPFKKEKILTKDDWVCESALGMQNSKKNCECADVDHFGELKNICNCTKQASVGYYKTEKFATCKVESQN
eukprot:gene9169-10142_t